MMQDQIQRVRELRNEVKVLQEKKSQREEEFRSTYAELFDDITCVKEKLNIEEQYLRDMTLQAYKETGNKVPAVGVGIRVVTKLLYDANHAFEWAKQHSLALKLDTPAFERFAKATKLEFVEVIEEPQATIATDLNKEKI